MSAPAEEFTKRLAEGSRALAFYYKGGAVLYALQSEEMETDAFFVNVGGGAAQLAEEINVMSPTEREAQIAQMTNELDNLLPIVDRSELSPPQACVWVTHIWALEKAGVLANDGENGVSVIKTGIDRS